MKTKVESFVLQVPVGSFKGTSSVAVTFSVPVGPCEPAIAEEAKGPALSV